MNGSAQNEGQVPHSQPTAGTPSLFTWARQWPTPKSSPSGPDYAKAARGAGGDDLVTAVARRWPTPSATDHKGSSKPGQRRGQLSEAALWPTATAGDAKASGSRGVRGEAGNKANEGTSLTDLTCRSGRPLPTTCTHGGECRPTLNPRFVAWLMGLPPSFLDDDKSSKPSETPSYPQSPK